MSEAFVFGGQGADPVPAARELDPALRRGLAELLDLDLARALQVGDRVLATTEVRQPLQVVVSLAVAERLPVPRFVLGHSLGALTARAFAIGWTPLEAARLARARGQAMARAAARAPGDLVAFRPPDARALVEAWPEHAAVAARNAPDEWVLAVRQERLADAVRRGGQRLRVGGPWHGPWMAAAAETLAPAFAELLATPPREGLTLIGADDLLADLTRPVPWEATLRRVGRRARSLVVVGPGRAQRALARRVLPGMPVRLVERPGARPDGLAHDRPRTEAS